MSHYTTTINPDNYQEKIKGVDLAKMPEIMRKSHDFIDKNTLHFTNWSAMQTSEALERMFNTYFAKLGDWMRHQDAAKPKTKVKKIIASKASKAPKKVAVVKQKEVDKSTYTAHFQTSEQLLKAFVNLDGKPATLRKVQLLHTRFQKSIIEKKVKNSHPNASIFKQAAHKLAKLYQKMVDESISVVEKLEIAGIDKFPDIKAEYQQLKISPAVSLLKRFVGMEGTKPTNAKVQSLVKGIESAIKNDKIEAEGKYREAIDNALNTLKAWLAAKQDSYIAIEEAQLAGLAGLGCPCQQQPIVEEALAGVPPKKKALKKKSSSETPETFVQKEIVKNIEEEAVFEFIESISLGQVDPEAISLLAAPVPAISMAKPMPPELLNIFTPINRPPKSLNQSFILPGGLGKFLGRIEDFEYAVVLRGEKGAGKTSLLYQIKNLFATAGKSVASFTLEIGKESNVVERLTNKFIAPANRDKIQISSLAPDGLATIRKVAKYFDVIAIDSWSKLNVKQDEFDKLRKECPKTMFIVIFQSTTGGTARGGSMAEYDAGTVIQVDAPGIAVCEKNRYAIEEYLDAKYDVHNRVLLTD